MVDTTAANNLLFAISPSADQLCCKTAATGSGGTGVHCGATSAGCTASNGKKKDFILMKMIANPNAIDFADRTTGTDTFNKNSGVFVPISGLFGNDVTDFTCAADQGCAPYLSGSNVKTAT